MMINKTIKNKLAKIVEQFLKDKRYLIILLLLIFALAFNRLFISLGSEDFVANQEAYQKIVTRDAKTLEVSQNSYIVKDAIQSLKNDNFRLILKIKSKSLSESIVEGYEEDLDDAESEIGLKDARFNISLSNSLGQSQKILSEKISANNQFKTFEYVFTTNSRYEDLVIERDDDGQITELVVGDISFTRLSDGNPLTLAETIIGNTDYSTIIAESDFEGAKKIKDVYETDSFVGQVFKANQEYISGVLFNMYFQGDGGIGIYNLELREVDFSDEKIVLVDSLLASSEFISRTSQKSNLVRDNKYYFQLCQKLEVGKYYAIGVNPSKTNSNFINHLSFFGYEDSGKYPDGNAIVVSKNGKVKSTGDLSFRLFGADFDIDEGNSIMNNAIIEDVGGGFGLYSYEWKNSSRDLLDVFQINVSQGAISDGGNKVNSAYYNVTDKAIMVPAKEDNNIVYKFYTKYNFSTIGVHIDQLSDDFVSSKVFYSFDNSDWREINLDLSNDQFNKEIVNNKSQNTLYIKIGYDKSQAEISKAKFFSIKSIRVGADLEIN